MLARIWRRPGQRHAMEPARWLLVAGTWLLSCASLLGFVQHRTRAQPDRVALWRVVHVGGTAGAVQLLALGAVWPQLPGTSGHTSALSGLVAGALIASTWAFFLGPLARALGAPRLADLVNRAGGLLALPAYLGLPLLLGAC
jgi:hypothetical protein